MECIGEEQRFTFTAETAAELTEEIGKYNHPWNKFFCYRFGRRVCEMRDRYDILTLRDKIILKLCGYGLYKVTYTGPWDKNAETYTRVYEASSAKAALCWLFTMISDHDYEFNDHWLEHWNEDKKVFRNDCGLCAKHWGIYAAWMNCCVIERIA